ncbi:hypothetical protein M2323_004257, partial [Rhodoblastus acidophilus]|nr:hypothetical protein [Rhodoblastus acidophilus]MCW2335311.1 hypothetical protein [Rhodoblastus acidophilus]
VRVGLAGGHFSEYEKLFGRDFWVLLPNKSVNGRVEKKWRRTIIAAAATPAAAALG